MGAMWFSLEELVMVQWLANEMEGIVKEHLAQANHENCSEQGATFEADQKLT